MVRSIYVQSQFVAYHRWVAAPESEGFLQAWHRHIFKVRVDLVVNTDDRDLEFFHVQKSLNKVLRKWEGLALEKSCEMFCDDILTALQPEYPTLFRVEVSEDGENGAVITLDLPHSGPVATS